MFQILNALHAMPQRVNRYLYLSILFACLADFVYFRIALSDVSSNVRCLHVIVACIGMWCMYALCLGRRVHTFLEIVRSLSFSFVWGAAIYTTATLLFLVVLDHDLRTEFFSPTLVFHALTFGLSAGTAEEIFFRGLLLSIFIRLLRNRVAHPLIIALVIEVALFTLSHYHPARLAAYYLVPFTWGIYLTLLTFRIGTLWPAIGVHAGYNAMQVIFAGATRPGFARVRGVFSVDPSLLPNFFLLSSFMAIISIAILYREKVHGCVLKILGRHHIVKDAGFDVPNESTPIEAKEHRY